MLLVGVAAEDQEVAGVEEGGGHVLYRIACGMVYDFGEREREREGGGVGEDMKWGFYRLVLEGDKTTTSTDQMTQSYV